MKALDNNWREAIWQGDMMSAEKSILNEVSRNLMSLLRGGAVVENFTQYVEKLSGDVANEMQAVSDARTSEQCRYLSKPSGLTLILTASGFTLNLDTPDATGLPVSDVARALAYQPRWCGASREFYSVAEHSVMVSRLVAPHLAYDALWHDALEFVTGGWPTPLKAFLGREEINRKLAPLETALSQWFGYRIGDTAVKLADMITMATELRDLLPPAWLEWSHLPPPSEIIIRPIGPEQAYALFLKRYEETKHLRIAK